MGAEEIGWKQKGSFDNTGRFKRGIGAAVGTHVSNAWPFCGDYSNAYLTMQQDGSISLATGVPDLGTGTITTLAQMAAEVLGISFEKVSVTFADTESTPFDIGSHASRTCYASGAAVVAAAKEMKGQILEFSSKLIDITPDKIDIEEDYVYSIEKPDQRINLPQIAVQAHLAGIQFIGVGKVIPQNAPPYMAHFADVEVDTKTGQVSIIKMVGVHDVGRAIHPQICEGQIEGGIVQGIGYAISEEVIYDKNGRQINNNFHKYMIPTSMDVPEIKALLVESNDPTHPFGVKGVGETGLVPTAAAIANAVYNATGIRMQEIPITAERLHNELVKNENIVNR
jgi:xanthine dehydrogenase molybdenum-binding subunit